MVYKGMRDAGKEREMECFSLLITLFVLYIFLSGISFSRRPSWRAQYKWSEQTPEVMAEYRAKRDALLRSLNDEPSF